MGKRLRKRNLPIARRKPLRLAILTVLGAVAGGAVLKHFLDPERGADRRNRAAQQSAAAVRQPLQSAGESASDVAQVAGDKAKAVATEVTTTTAEQLPESDRTLADKVRSEVLGQDRWKDAQVNVSAAEGVVTLHGQLQTPNDVKALLKAVRSVPGVTEVESNVHLPRTPAPNKQKARQASDKATGDTPA